MRELVAEDEKLLADTLAVGLRRRAMAVDVCYDGPTAIDLATTHDYDVLVLDRDLPGCRGDDVCQAVVAAGASTRVLMLTAAATVRDRVEGLGLGADDYLVKPFAFEELVARVEALSRRAHPAVPPVLSCAGVDLDVPRHQASRDGRHLRLSKKEFGVLTLLMSRPGQVVSAEEMLEKVWDMHADPFTNSVRMTMSTLRQKLGDPPVIDTVIGVGYRFTT